GAAFALAVPIAVACAGPRQQIFPLGDFRLDDGSVIEDGRLGYRVWGRLDPSDRNVVLLTTWMQGTTAELANELRAGIGIDRSRFVVVAVDAFGNGVSSSPSNSTRQAGHLFPPFTIRDMVRAQHELLTRGLGVSHLK